MSHIIDLTMPVSDHFRWPVERQLKADFAQGDDFQITWVGWTVHGFTHVDAPRHMVPDGATTSDLKLEQVMGRAAIVDLTDVQPNQEISTELLQVRGQHIEANDIVLLKTCWEVHESPHTAAFWKRSPYLTRGACEWLLKKQVKAVGFDFPQDYPIRLLLNGEVAALATFVSHDVLLRSGILLIEYLCNLGAITGKNVQLYALPLKIPDADGAPARVIAIEETKS